MIATDPISGRILWFLMDNVVRKFVGNKTLQIAMNVFLLTTSESR